jgi:hypothetical protein
MNMENDEFAKKMENISTPDISSEARKKHLKITLLNARKSARVGILLVIIPFVFAIANIFKYNFGVDLGFISNFVEWIASLDTVPVVNWMVRLLLLGGPLVAVLANIFAITHFYTDRELKEFVVTFKLKWLNIAIILICSTILLAFLFYLMVENISHQ